MTSKIGFDIGSIKEEDLEKVYSSIDLSDTLVVFEDLERSTIDIIEILGYVNSLVEQDRAKVMLVANENEILKYHDSKPDKGGKTYKIPNEETVFYLKIKEKTVSDTIFFTCDIKSAIKSIIESFKNPTLNRFKTDKKIKEIIKIMSDLDDHNLRSFMFACQKTVDIYEKLDNVGQIEEVYLATIFHGIIALSISIKNDKFPEFEHSAHIYHIHCPKAYHSYILYRFCYNYVRWQQFDMHDVKMDLEEHKKKIFLRKRDLEDENDLSVIFSYFLYSEKEVKSSLKKIENRLSDPYNIPIYSYERLAYYFIKLNSLLDFDYSICQKRMLDNLTSKKEDIDDTSYFEWSFQRYNFDTEDEKKQFIDFSEKVSKALNIVVNSYNELNFSYDPKDINQLFNNVAHNRERVITNHEFISKFELNMLIDMIFKCHPSELYDFRRILLAIYGDATKGSFLDVDSIFMEDLKGKLEKALADQSLHLDRILKLQVEYLIDDLTKFIE